MGIQDHVDFRRPAKGTTTEAVWALADRITAEQGYKAKRKQVIDAFAAEGGNANTASTQYHYWSQCYAVDDDSGPGSSISSIPLRIESNGRMLLPAEVRKAMGIEGAMQVTAKVVDGELHVISPVMALEKLRQIAGSQKKPDQNVVDEFLRDRKSEWGEE